MSDIRFNQWLHQSGTGGVSQVASGAVGVGTTNPLADFYVRGDAQITGILTAGHIAMGSSITFGDDDRAYFGDGTDLHIYHQSSDNTSRIQHIGNATPLFLQSTNDVRIEPVRLFQVRNQSSHDNYILATNDGSVDLFFNGSKKIETTNTGAVVTGILTATGMIKPSDGIQNTGGNISLLDRPDGNSQNLFFGTGAKAAAYHDGTNFTIINNTGHAYIGVGVANKNLMLYAQSTGNVILQRNTGHKYFEGVGSDGTAIIYHNTNEKIRTTNTGAVVTGIITATSRVSLGNNTTNAVDLEFGTNRGSAGDTLANINWKWNNTYVAQIRGMAGSDTTNKDDAHLNFYTAAAGSLVERLRITSTGKVGINSTNPDAPLTLYTTASQAWKFRINTSASDGAGFYQRSNGDFEMVLRDASNNNNYIAGTSGALQFATSGGERLRITSNGRVSINDGTRSADDANAGATLRVTGTPITRNEYFSPHGHYFGAIGYTDNTNTKAWLAVDSHYAQSSAVSAGIFLSAFHQDAGGSDCGYTIKNLKTGNALVFSRVKTAASTGNPAVEEERVRITSDGNMGLGLTPAYSGLFGGAQRTFHIGGTAAPCLRITSSSSGQADLVVHAGNSGRRADIANMATNGTISIWTKPSSGSIAERMLIGSTGIIDAPTQAGFYARLNTNKNDKTGDGTYYTVEWDTDSGSICYDQHNTFSTSTGLYTIPTGGDGVYQFATAVCLSTDVYGRNGEAWFVVGGLRIFFDRKYFTSTSGTITGYYGSCIAKMTAGQTIGVQVFVTGGAKNVDVFGAGANDHISWFSGRKIA